MFKSKIKWVALGGLVLSLLSLFVHMFLANTSVELVQYHVITGFVEDLNVNVVGKQVMFVLDLMFCRCVFTINCNCSVCMLIIIFALSGCCSVLHLESCGRRSSLWRICSRMQILEINIPVIKCSFKYQVFRVLYAYQKFWE